MHHSADNSVLSLGLPAGAPQSCQNTGNESMKPILHGQDRALPLELCSCALQFCHFLGGVRNSPWNEIFLELISTRYASLWVKGCQLNCFHINSSEASFWTAKPRSSKHKNQWFFNFCVFEVTRSIDWSIDQSIYLSKNNNKKLLICLLFAFWVHFFFNFPARTRSYELWLCQIRASKSDRRSMWK